MRYCPYCGAKVQETATFCPNCGAALKVEEAAPKAEETTAPRTAREQRREERREAREERREARAEARARRIEEKEEKQEKEEPEKHEKHEKGEKREKEEKGETREYSYIGPLVGGMIIFSLGLSFYLQVLGYVGMSTAWSMFFAVLILMIIIAAVLGTRAASRRHPKTE
jgi:Flp pilus assembly protein TadB